MTLDTLALGAAGEYLVCADLIMHGYRGWQAPNNFSYDVIAEIEGRLVRISVKSTLKPMRRPGRVASKECYRWRCTRSSSRGQKPFTKDLTDLVAVVGLDTKLIGYLPVSECPGILEIEAPHGLPSKGKYGPRELKLRTFEDFPLLEALRRINPAVEGLA